MQLMPQETFKKFVQLSYFSLLRDDQMTQKLSVEQIVKELTTAGSFSRASIKVNMGFYYSENQYSENQYSENQDLDLNWVYHLSRYLQKQMKEKVHPEKLFRSISSPEIKENTNPPIMFQENYFKIAELNEKSNQVMRNWPLSVQYHTPEEVSEALLYITNERGYDVLVQHDKLNVSMIVADFASNKNYGFDSNDPEDIENEEETRSFLQLNLIDFSMLEQTVKMDFSEEEISEVGDYIEEVYEILDQYVGIGKNILKESSEFSENLSGSRLFYELGRLRGSQNTQKIALV